MSIRRALVLVDHAAGDLRLDADEVRGIDLWPATEAALDSVQSASALAGATVDVTLVARGSDEWSEALNDWVSGADLAVSGESGSQETNMAADGPAVGPPAGDVAVVTADRRLRGDVAITGMQPVPHVALLPLVVEGQTPRCVLMTGSRDALVAASRSGTTVPMSFQSTGDKWTLIAVVDRAVLQAAAAGEVDLTVLPCDPLVDDVAWVRPGDPQGHDVDQLFAGARILHVETDQVLIALGPEDDIDDFHVDGAHGHTEFLALDPHLLDPPAKPGSEASLEGLAMFQAADAQGQPIIEHVKQIVLSPVVLKRLFPSCSAVTTHYESDLDRYTGVTALDADGTIESRHISHLDNKRVESQLMRDLRAMGYCPWRHTFTHNGQTHSNIIADLPGRGIFKLARPILERYRKILGGVPRLPRRAIDGLDGSSLTELIDASYFDRHPLELSDREFRHRIEAVLQLRAWYPWWKVKCPMAGFGADLVVVGCHLDSTAGFDSGYDPLTDAAPGRDDNGSGVAGVLSLARYFATLTEHLTHTVRFCFFNAEEQGLVGSKAYAALLKATEAPVRAVVCMDMMGYNSDAERLFEVHAGYTDAAVRDDSVPLADAVAAAAASQGRLGPAQVYQGTSWSGSPDRSVYDGAINRSDHAAFHQQGYPAVLVSEDFFANLSSEPSADPNPQYHRSGDTVVDLDYARDIVCAVNQAVINLAR